MPREDILWGSAGVEKLNETINGEGDGLFLLDVLVIVNRMSDPPLLTIMLIDFPSCRL